MELPTHILLIYGYFLLFGWVLVEQLGVPLPAMPVLLLPARSPPRTKSVFRLPCWLVWPLR